MSRCMYCYLMKGKAFLDHSDHHAIFIFLSKMVGKIKIFKNMHGDTMNNSDELTHKKMKFPSYCRTPEDNQMVSS